MAESPTRTMPATRGRYRQTKELGHGATATVWRARDTETGRDVALKRFHPHLVADPIARQRIEEEAAAASRVSHPSVVTAVDVVDDREGLALVFPYVKGVTLAKRLADRKQLAARTAARIALDIADGLAVAHASGIIHRDVKPANIILGADGRARLLDFGISQAIDELDENNRLTGAGLAIGTLPYMAPEQLAAGPVTPASDVYGLGVVLYEMLGGRLPYAAASPVTLAEEQKQPPPRIGAAPKSLVDLTFSALAADAALRPEAAQLARGLRAWLDGRAEAEAATVTHAAASAPASSRPRLGWVAAGVAVVLLAIGLPVAASALLPAKHHRLDIASGQIALPVQSAPPPVGTPVPPQAPVVAATDPEPPSNPVGGGHHRHHHHKHHRHHHHPGHGG